MPPGLAKQLQRIILLIGMADSVVLKAQRRRKASISVSGTVQRAAWFWMIVSTTDAVSFAKSTSLFLILQLRVEEDPWIRGGRKRFGAMIVATLESDILLCSSFSTTLRVRVRCCMRV